MAYETENFVDTSKLVWNYSLFTDEVVEAFRNGKLHNAYQYFGNHYRNVLKEDGYYFAVWAPNATAVHIIGEFNGWKQGLHKLYVRLDESGIWEGFIPRLPQGALYKYHIVGFNGIETWKADPYATFAQLRPETASITRRLQYTWTDTEWMQKRKHHNSLQAPWSVYEMHLGSWMRPEKDKPNVFNSYHTTREKLIPYLKGMGYTHVEFMPITEYPYDGSWGYQATGFFAATSRYGVPEDLMHLINELHANNIGVILDWVPSHFPGDAHGLYTFDGTHTYEYEDMRKGFHKDWNSYIFNYARGEVRSFLLSSAHFWFNYFHIDGIRVDAVNSIIRLDFSRGEGEWEPNEKGTNENVEAISFLQEFNKMAYQQFDGIQTIAEEASDWPDITTPVDKGGLGFGMKWMMGWMHDTFRYFKKDWKHRSKAQNDFSFSIMYFYDEKFMLPISHDEVVHGKSPMIYKMPGDEWQQFANLRLLYSYMFTHPGAKLNFMGNEFGQTNEWDYNSELPWELLQHDCHNGLQECVRRLNHLYVNEPALYQLQFEKKGFAWENLDNPKKGIIVYRRSGKTKANDMVVLLNVSSNPVTNWELTLKGKLHWQEIFNSNNATYWGTGEYLNTHIETQIVDKRAKQVTIKVNVNAFSCCIIQ
jgi:1,4-alpha-glucan branching enzyme